jgi:hypothetical protein
LRSSGPALALVVVHENRYSSSSAAVNRIGPDEIEGEYSGDARQVSGIA